MEGQRSSFKEERRRTSSARKKEATSVVRPFVTRVDVNFSDVQNERVAQTETFATRREHQKWM